jgi:hypothetical protein
MKRWGIVITVFYAIIMVVLVVPGVLLFCLRHPTAREFFDIVLEAYHLWDLWIWLAILIGGQALLLFLSVDTSWRRLKPRQHVAVTAALAGLLTALLTFAAVWSLAAGISGDHFDKWPLQPWNGSRHWLFAGGVLVWAAVLWAIWGAVFYLHYRSVSEPLSAIVSWLLKGSALELLVALPAHIIVRHRNDCSAPVVTGWGIVTGVAVMLLCFGPGILALYKKRLDGYAQRRIPNQ